jgi:hypothetical protein
VNIDCTTATRGNRQLWQLPVSLRHYEVDAMALRTALTDVLGLQHPILLAPMAGVSGGALAAAVSHAGDCRRGRRLDPRHTFRKCYRARHNYRS